MLSQEILNAVDELMQDQMIKNIDICFRSYADLPEIRIQSKQDVLEQEVISLVNNSLCELKPKNSMLDFDHINCWGNSYNGETSEFEITLITSTTKEKSSAQDGANSEKLQSDFTINDMPVKEYLKREG